MQGGWGGPRAPAHEPNIYPFCHLAETVGNPASNPSQQPAGIPRGYARPRTRAWSICHGRRVLKT